MINGYPTASFLSGGENTTLYRWVMRSTGHIIFADANQYSHNMIIANSGLNWYQIIAAGYYYPHKRQSATAYNETKKSWQEINELVQEAFDEKVTHESHVKLSGDYLDAFGYWNGHLYIADRHHADILKRLIDEGATWEQLMDNPPVFGWLQHTDPHYYDEETDTDKEIFDRPRDEIAVLFNTDTGAPKPTQEQMEPVLKAISKHYGVPAFNNPLDINMDLWQEGTSYDMGVDSYEYNLRNAPIQNMLDGWNEGDEAEVIDPNSAENGKKGEVVSIDYDDYEHPILISFRNENGNWDEQWYSLDQLRKLSANGWYKWIYNPENDDYQEWLGDHLHYQMAKMLWPNSKIDQGQWWGGTRKIADPYFNIGYFPPELNNLNRAKQYIPGNLLQNLMNRHIQEQNATMSRGNYE